MSDYTKEYTDYTGNASVNLHTPTQETQMTETTQELPAVNKLREAFEVARNAIVDGSELAKQVQELRGIVDTLRTETTSLKHDLEYVRSRNKELDEQVTEVRRQRDNALADNVRIADKLAVTERERDDSYRVRDSLNSDYEELKLRLANAARERDDAMTMALEYETKLKAAEATLTKLKLTFGEAFGEPTGEAKPKPHYLDQPRDEVGKFQPTTYDRGSQSESSGF